MKLTRRTGIVAGLLTFLALTIAAPAALAAPTVTVRIEGATQTLLPATTVTLDSATVPTNAGCPGNSVGGALEKATNGNWDRQSFVQTIMGETHSFTHNDSWFDWVSGKLGNGICADLLSEGDEVVLIGGTYDPISFQPLDYPLVLAVPANAAVGKPFTVTAYDSIPDFNNGMFGSGSGIATPAAGVTVSAGGASAVTGADGRATLTPAAAGQLVVQAARSTGVSRSRTYPVCVSNGDDGTCGTTKPVVIDRTAPASSLGALANVASYAKGKGPRELKGSVSDPSGVLMVKLRITRTYGGHCSYFSGSTLTFRAMRCGASNGSWFKIGSAGAWSYLLPKRLAAGRYVVDVNAIDKAYNRDDARRRGGNRVVFVVK